MKQLWTLLFCIGFVFNDSTGAMESSRQDRALLEPGKELVTREYLEASMKHIGELIASTNQRIDDLRKQNGEEFVTKKRLRKVTEHVLEALSALHQRDDAMLKEAYSCGLKNCAIDLKLVAKTLRAQRGHHDGCEEIHARWEEDEKKSKALHIEYVNEFNEAQTRLVATEKRIEELLLK